MIDNVLALEIENILKQANINVNKKNFKKVKDFVVKNYDVEELTKDLKGPRLPPNPPPNPKKHSNLPPPPRPPQPPELVCI